MCARASLSGGLRDRWPSSANDATLSNGANLQERGRVDSNRNDAKPSKIGGVSNRA